MQNIAQKYNWWTHAKDKNDISLDTQIEYVLKMWNMDEIVFVLKNFIEKVNIVFQNITIKDQLISDERKQFLSSFISIANKKYEHKLGSKNKNSIV